LSGRRGAAARMPEAALGVISAGGASRRFGSAKAVARVGGRRVVDRVAQALRAVVGAGNVVAVVNEPALAETIGLPHRSDVLRGAGAVAGVHTALVWARERGMPGALVVGCDMPFVEPALLGALLERSRAGADMVIPESEGRRGVEPLCAYYAISCIDAIEAAVARGDARMIGFHDDVDVRRLPLDDVRAIGDPARLFMNLNTPADLAAAEALDVFTEGSP
jgi:molybdopterin-guanine dinucleotide biosynthesis protein A